MCRAGRFGREAHHAAAAFDFVGDDARFDFVAFGTCMHAGGDQKQCQGGDEESQ
ncbi:hypothetical protein D3C81_2182440 [compost metagenome]